MWQCIEFGDSNDTFLIKDDGRHGAGMDIGHSIHGLNGLYGSIKGIKDGV